MIRKHSDRAGQSGGQQDYWRSLLQKRDAMLNVHSEVARRRGPLGDAIAAIGRTLAHPVFFTALLLVHLGWIAVNLGAIPGLRPFDPPPFALLALIASVEAPFIALLILMRQSQDRRIEDLRGETELQVALHVERETTRALRMLTEIQAALGVQSGQDPGELARLKQDLDPSTLMEEVRRSIDEADPGGST